MSRKNPLMRPVRWSLLALLMLARTANAAEGSVQALRHFELLQAAQVRYSALAADPGQLLDWPADTAPQ